MTAQGFSLSFVEVLVAKERGFFDGVGLDLDIKGGPGTAEAIQAVLGGSVDIARTHGINTMIAIANESAPLKAMATLRQKSQFEICSLAEAPIRGPQDMIGKSVGVITAGGSTENLLDVMLIANGVDPETVTRPITGVGTAAYELAKSGQIDAWISVNTDRQIIHETLGDVYYFSTDEYAQIPSDTYNVAQSVIDSGSDMPAKFLAGVLLALDYSANESNWEQVVRDLQVYSPDTSTEQSLKTISTLVDSWRPHGGGDFLQFNEAAWTDGQEFLAQAGVINSTVPLEDMVFGEYLEQARTMI